MTKLAKPTEADFSHGSPQTCYVCERYGVKCLRFGGMTHVCAKCFPWWLLSQRPTEVHHHAAPSFPSYIPRFEVTRERPKRPDMRKRC